MDSTRHRALRGFQALLFLGYGMLSFLWGGSPAHAQEADDPIVAQSFQEAIILDGQLSERSWNEATAISFVDQREVSDNEITVRALWNDESIYLGIEVRDGHLETRGIEVWRDDCIELFFDPQLDGGDYMQPNDIQIIINVIGRAELRRGTGTWDTEIQDLPETLSYGVWITPLGYSQEIRIAWDELGVTPETDLVMGMEISNRDYDPVLDVSFNRSGGFNLEADSWGLIELQGEILPIVDPDFDAGVDADVDGDPDTSSHTYRITDLGCSASSTRASRGESLALLIFVGILWAFLGKSS